MNNWYYRLVCLLVMLTLVGCGSLPISLENGTQVVTATAGAPPGSAITPIATHETDHATPPPGEQFLRIWLPPEFDPDGNSSASMLLKTRLNEFKAKNPALGLDIRVKALDGAGGLLDSLVAANAAAPSTLPDLVLLPRPILESAALKGLLYPFDGLTNIMNDRSWFEYARQLALLKTSTYGIPFAGDIMVLVHSLSSLETTPPSLEATLNGGKVLLYPAADPQALFTLCLYVAAGGGLQDVQGRPALEQDPLVRILDFDQQANQADVIPNTLAEFSDDSQVWQAFMDGQYPMAVTWASQFLSHEQADLGIAPLPTLDGAPFTLGTGWSWALAGQDSARRTLSVQLVEYLVEKEFMAKWTQAAGYLPPKVDALQGWQPTQSHQVIEQISYSAHLIPSADLVSTIGPVLQRAVIEVLSGQSEPTSAAQAAIEKIKRP